jgi:UDP-3-O-[3-hydroxymyristoyl] glucosamine N-acyltransferase
MGVIVGGQAGLVGHADIGAGVRIAAQAGVQGDVPAGETLGGSPAQPHGKWLRNVTAFEHLAEMRRELRELRREVDRLRGADGGKKEGA